MSISQEVLDHTLLAEFAYLRLEDYEFEYNDINKLKEFISKTVDINRQTKMENILDKYEIINFESFDGLGESDLQMMLLKDKSTGEYVISYRGTAGFHDLVITDIAQMGLKLKIGVRS